MQFSFKWKISLLLTNQKEIDYQVPEYDIYFDLIYKIYIIEDNFNVVNKIGFLFKWLFYRLIFGLPFISLSILLQILVQFNYVKHNKHFQIYLVLKVYLT